MGKRHAAPAYVLDHNIGVTDDGKLMGYDGREWAPADHASLDIKLSTDKGEQLTTYGKVMFYQTPGRNLLACQFHFADKSTKWVPLSGRKNRKVKKVKVEVAARHGEALFDPQQYKAR